ncbi:MAG: LPS export ABC transporter periplasmic protein LptC [Bacteroidales bacterium]|nr:LPS export ABC transporter periplasmic protein LptC [Bacteroidales bacterium]
MQWLRLRPSKLREACCNPVGRRAKGTLPCFVLLLTCLAACRNDMEKVRFFDPQTLPQQSLDSIRVVRSTDGKKQMVLTAPHVAIFDKPESKTVYDRGVHMQVFDASKIVADIQADTAVQNDQEKTIMAHGNVVIIDFRSGDTTYMNSVVWNSRDHRVYSDEPVKSVNGLRVTYGDGFESDEDFTSPQIKHQRGTVTFEE